MLLSSSVLNYQLRKSSTAATQPQLQIHEDYSVLRLLLWLILLSIKCRSQFALCCFVCEHLIFFVAKVYFKYCVLKF